ncbi:serine/threonine-protein kinase [Haloferula sp. BvORR071]|uniref:serine/threonine-protein kinase n=1 Tax=Haloferula sp. BvORR071 TaxID=1396141 RepID=UPI0005584BF0|nr:serine/threonine-protein kinase [Haloferula sp. BvORR071]
MNGDASRKIDKALFEAASAIDDAEARQVFLAMACGVSADAARVTRVTEWLEEQEFAEAFFRNAAIERAAVSFEVAEEMESGALSCQLDPVEDAPGSRVGRYLLLERIGEGGCGVVYMAEQLEPVQRRVALKVIRSGLDSAGVMARFEAERQTLALMDHPGIARVFDAGATDSGRPYFVMEMVFGDRITSHCDTKRLGLRQRLELFIQVCQAIQHAHQKGIIHRDIKPSNVLVSDQDGAALPKVIDFGISRAVEARLSDETYATTHGQLIGTPAYMSPEQAEGGQDPDTRGDVYSLGVLLHELLTGRTPFDGKRLSRAGLFEMLRILREEEPPAPSLVLSRLGTEELAEVATARDCTAATLVTAVRGDLDGIVAKAMAKERAGRYDTVNGLAADLRRFLNDEPVSARPPGKVYLLRKLLRRHKLVFAAAAAVTLALVAGLSVSSWFYVREREARQVQVSLRETAEAARANEAHMLQQSKARESVSLAAMRLAEGRMEEADQLLLETPLASIDPSREAANVFLALGDWNAIRQRTNMAADCYAMFLQANRRDPAPVSQSSMMLISVGPTLVEAGRYADYQRFRSDVIDRSEKIEDPTAVGHLLKACLLMPADEALLARMQPHAERLTMILSAPTHPQSMDAYQSAFTALSLAMLAYRSGDSQGALEWCAKCWSYPDSNEARTASIHAIAAMATRQLGQTAQANIELARARALLAAPYDRDVVYPRGQGTGMWLDWSIARVLEREAAGLIGCQDEDGETR